MPPPYEDNPTPGYNDEWQFPNGVQPGVKDAVTTLLAKLLFGFTSGLFSIDGGAAGAVTTQPTPIFAELGNGDDLTFDAFAYAVTSQGGACTVNGVAVPNGLKLSSQAQSGKKFTGIAVVGPAFVHYDPIA